MLAICVSAWLAKKKSSIMHFMKKCYTLKYTFRAHQSSPTPLLSRTHTSFSLFQVLNTHTTASLALTFTPFLCFAKIFHQSITNCHCHCCSCKQSIQSAAAAGSFTQPAADSHSMRKPWACQFWHFSSFRHATLLRTSNHACLRSLSCLFYNFSELLNLLHFRRWHLRSDFHIIL